MPNMGDVGAERAGQGMSRTLTAWRGGRMERFIGGAVLGECHLKYRKRRGHLSYLLIIPLKTSGSHPLKKDVQERKKTNPFVFFVKCHVSHVTCHVSHVTCHMSRVTVFSF